MNITIAISVACMFVISACTPTAAPEPTPKEPSYTHIASATVSGYEVNLYADAAVTVGYTAMHVRIMRNGAALRNVHLTVTPDMDMGMMHHGCPVEQPDSDTADVHGYYHVTSIFTMPSETAWTLGITFRDYDRDSVATVHMRVPVGSASTVKTYKDASNTKYVCALLSPTTMVGMNDIKFSLYRSTDGFVYSPVEDAILNFEPTMPSMGHGSHGNIQPAYSTGGWYTGRVNYTMTGDWQIDLSIRTSTNDSFAASFPVVVR